MKAKQEFIHNFQSFGQHTVRFAMSCLFKIPFDHCLLIILNHLINQTCHAHYRAVLLIVIKTQT